MGPVFLLLVLGVALLSLGPAAIFFAIEDRSNLVGYLGDAGSFAGGMAAAAAAYAAWRSARATELSLALIDRGRRDQLQPFLSASAPDGTLFLRWGNGEDEITPIFRFGGPTWEQAGDGSLLRIPIDNLGAGPAMHVRLHWRVVNEGTARFYEQSDIFKARNVGTYTDVFGHEQQHILNYPARIGTDNGPYSTGVPYSESGMEPICPLRAGDMVDHLIPAAIMNAVHVRLISDVEQPEDINPYFRRPIVATVHLLIEYQNQLKDNIRHNYIITFRGSGGFSRPEGNMVVCYQRPVKAVPDDAVFRGAYSVDVSPLAEP